MRIAIVFCFAAALAFAQVAPGKKIVQKRPILDAGAIRDKLPAGVQFLPDLAYRQGHEAWTLDLAMPKPSDSPARPAVVLVHGGGWGNGDKRLPMFSDLMLDYASKGYVAASINYRLSGHAPLPAAIEDVKCAVRWLRANAKTYGIDPNHIGALGNSAGGHLVEMLALSDREPNLDGDCPHRDQPSAVQAVVTICGFGELGGRLLQGSRPLELLGPPATEFAAKAKRFSPISYASAKAPAMLFLHGTADETSPHVTAVKTVEALRGAGAKHVTLLSVEGAGHNVFLSTMPMSGAAVAAFFEKHLRAR